jgi:hypothetical protein
VIGQTITVAASTVYVNSAAVTINSGTITCSNIVSWVAAPAGATITYFVDGVSKLSSFTPAVGARVIEAVLTVSTTAGTASARLGLGVQANGTGSVTISEPQAEQAARRSGYQYRP